MYVTNLQVQFINCVQKKYKLAQGRAIELSATIGAFCRIVTVHFLCSFQSKEPEQEKVCGSNGVTYPNECSLKAASCTSQTEITVSYIGDCGKSYPLSFVRRAKCNI